MSATADRSGDEITFVVADTGIGIATEDQERIFEDFIQIESALQGRAKGTGLGLPLCRKLAHLLGGQVSVASAPGVGSTFSLTVPRVYAPDEEPAPVEMPTPTRSVTRC